MKWLSVVVLATFLAGCSRHDDSVLEVTEAPAPDVGRSAPLEIALRQRRHGDLVCHFYNPGAVYDIHVTPLRVTTILFQDDERVVTIGAGDTERFNVDLTETDGKHALLVKPIAAGIRTNVSVITDRRVYVLDLIADSSTNYVVAFEPFSEDRLEPMATRSSSTVTPLMRPVRSKKQPGPGSQTLVATQDEGVLQEP